jgi:hypothetical protein
LDGRGIEPLLLQYRQSLRHAMAGVQAAGGIGQYGKKAMKEVDES